MRPSYRERMSALGCCVPARFALLPGNVPDATGLEDLAYDGSFLLELNRLFRREGISATPAEPTSSSFAFQVHDGPVKVYSGTVFIDAIWGQEHLPEVARALGTVVQHLRRWQARGESTHRPGGALTVVLSEETDEIVQDFSWECGEDPLSEVVRTVTTRLNLMELAETQQY